MVKALKLFSLAFASFYCLHIASAQVLIMAVPQQIEKPEQERLSKLLRRYEVVSLDALVLRKMCDAKKTGVKAVLLAARHRWEIELEENELRSSAMRTSENGENGSLEGVSGKCVTFKGTEGLKSGNAVRMTVTEEYIDGYVTIDERVFYVKPLGKMLKGYGKSSHHVIFQPEDIIENPNVKDCGIEQVENARTGLTNGVSARATTQCRFVEIATEADFEYFQNNGSSVVNTNNTILTILNQVEGVYQTTFNIRFVVTFQSVWSSVNDPYSVTAPPGNIQSPATGRPVLDELANWWQANRNSVPRDMVYFFSHKGHSVRGSARMFGAICANLSNSYAFTATAVATNVGNTTAHEIGYLFSATHPNQTGTGPDLASCQPTPTLMCLLDQIADNRVLQFSPFSQNEINNWIGTNNACLNELASVSISGPVSLCSSAQLSVSGLPPNSTVTQWNPVPSNGLTIGNLGFTTRTNNFQGNVEVTAMGMVGMTGCTFTTTRIISVGSPMLGTYTFGCSGCQGSQPRALSTVNFVRVPIGSGSVSITACISQPGASGWQWTLQSGNAGFFGGNGDCLSFSMNIGQSATFVVSANVENCGRVSRTLTFNVSTGSGFGGFAVFPNPSGEEISVYVLDETAIAGGAGQSVESLEAKTKPKRYSAELYSASGDVVQRVEGERFPFSLNVKNLKEGSYFLHIVRGAEKAVEKSL